MYFCGVYLQLLCCLSNSRLEHVVELAAFGLDLVPAASVAQPAGLLMYTHASCILFNIIHRNIETEFTKQLI